MKRERIDADRGPAKSARPVTREGMRMERTRRSLTLKMHIIARLARGRFDLRARSIGLTRSQWQVIFTIYANEGVTQRRIATLLEVREVSVGRMIDKLVDEGLLERRRDEEDRRAYRLYLTPAAAPVLAQLEALGSDEERLTLAGISEADKDHMHMVLDQVIANLGGIIAVPGATDEN
jgi:DNA-binding MarR family transcriptional regulator